MYGNSRPQSKAIHLLVFSGRGGVYNHEVCGLKQGHSSVRIKGRKGKVWITIKVLSVKVGPSICSP